MNAASDTHTNRLKPPMNGRLDHVLGDADAPITLVEYGSFNCALDAIHDRVESPASKLLRLVGFTMSLYIARKAFPDESDFAAAKIGIFLASLIAGGLGTALLWSAAGSASGESKRPT